MDHEAAGRYWDENAEAWTALARAGYDVYRDHLNTPAFFEALPAVSGLVGLDIGCGEGHNTRLLADRGARMTGIDIAPRFIAHAERAEAEAPRAIAYRVASAVALPFADGSFDFATGFMSFMDIPETDRVLAEAYRMLRPGGFLQFSISHPCFETPHRRPLRGPDGRTYAVEVGDYFREGPGEVQEWIFSEAPAELKRDLPRFRIPHFHRPLSTWLNLLLAAGFRLEHVGEPCPTAGAIAAYPRLQNARAVAMFLHLRGRRPD